ncbi:hypothetical protein Ssi03_77340 [Sphaerisporangium siamense]|uniref:Uncharacterized protein n=1 Tax=Sphaerisporangium siamense TaxID=795645 RepID=A0A7W7DGE8_9ACTN|nr:hypothetical protein [Sphaerisporangium siamense]MBB4706156.1 hypothetical protein [Sphaerisporangium siamense]GII89744.1 hypothetical protein Ssi03_77340 [Sphaerisporangium siamense]
MTREPLQLTPAGKTYTAAELGQMAGHIAACALCTGDDEQMREATYAEDLPPEELEDYIRLAHGVEDWRQAVGR